MSQVLHAELAAALTATLAQMSAAVTQLTSTLASERDALLAGDVQGINQAGAQKQALMQQLEQLDAERVQLLGNQAMDTAHDGTWQLVLEALAQCRQLNQHNGSVVGQKLGQVRQALSILTGRSAETSVYGRSGTVHSPSRWQTLAEA